MPTPRMRLTDARQALLPLLAELQRLQPARVEAGLAQARLAGAAP